MSNNLGIKSEDQNILSDFFKRRQVFDNYIAEQRLGLFTCPGCGYPTLGERGGYEICDVCNWEDDNQDDKEADEVWGGPNGKLSLTENRINIGRTLEEIALEKGGELITNPAEAFVIIDFFTNKKNSIVNRMTGNETLEHPIWIEWYQGERNLLQALVK